MTEYKMDLSTSAPNNHVGLLNIRQDDEGSQVFKAKITSNNLQFKLQGYQVFFNARFENMIIARDLVDSVDFQKQEVTYTLKSPFYQQIGRIDSFFSFEKDGVRDSTANFNYSVVPGNCRNIRQGNYIYELEQLFLISEDIIKNKDFSILINSIDEANRMIDEINNHLNGRIDTVAANVASLSADQTAHANNKENPHNVTAKQVGTLTKEEITTELNKKLDGLSSNETLWTGFSILGPAHTITPSKALSKCQNGWVIYWSTYSNEQGVYENQIVKSTILKADARLSNGSKVIVEHFMNARTAKPLYKGYSVSDTTIKGQEYNITGDNISMGAYRIDSF